MFKRIFSRFALVALVIILTFVVEFLFTIGPFVAAIAVIEYFAPASAIWLELVVTCVNGLIVFLAILHCANRDMVPETKIPWILCIVAFNLFGVAIYATFSSHRPSRKTRAWLKRTYARAAAASLPEDENVRASMGRWAAVSEIITATSPGSVPCGGTKTEYLPSGEEFFARLFEDIDHAEKFIFLEFFIVARGKLWDECLSHLLKKKEEGVEIRLMYDDVGSMGRLPTRFHKKMQKLGIKCVRFNSFVPVVSNVHNNRDHRKIAVIDGKVGYTGGLNLADEYVNLVQPHGHWRDCGIRMEGSAVRELTLLFLCLYGANAGGVEEPFEPYITDYSCEGRGTVHVYGDGPAPLHGKHLGEDVYLAVLSAARRYVYISTPYLIVDYRMREALVLAAKRGVDVRIMTPHIPDKKVVFALTRSTYSALIAGGVKIYEYTPGFVHAKAFLADDEAGVLGTINLDYRSFLYHFEDAVFLHGAEALEGLKADFENGFEKSELQTAESAKRSVVWRGVCEVAKLFAPLF